MKAHDKFIETYKELESVIRDEYETVRVYEEQLPEVDSKKLQICRILRNYIQHNADYEKFIQISPNMQSFLEEQVYKVQSLKGVLKDAMLSVAKYGCLFDDTCSVIDAAAILTKKKRNYGIVVNKTGDVIGLLSKSIISDLVGEKAITSTTKISKIVDKLDVNYRVKYLLSSTPMDIVNGHLDKDSELIIVIVNKAGNIVGLYNI